MVFVGGVLSDKTRPPVSTAQKSNPLPRKAASGGSETTLKTLTLIGREISEHISVQDPPNESRKTKWLEKAMRIADNSFDDQIVVFIGCRQRGKGSAKRRSQRSKDIYKYERISSRALVVGSRKPANNAKDHKGEEQKHNMELAKAEGPQAVCPRTRGAGPMTLWGPLAGVGKEVKRHDRKRRSLASHEATLRDRKIQHDKPTEAVKLTMTSKPTAEKAASTTEEDKEAYEQRADEAPSTMKPLKGCEREPKNGTYQDTSCRQPDTDRFTLRGIAVGQVSQHLWQRLGEGTGTENGDKLQFQQGETPLTRKTLKKEDKAKAEKRSYTKRGGAECPDGIARRSRWNSQEE